jgi:serine/threonine-protein kinase RsbW
MNKPTYLSDGIIIPSSSDFLADVDRYLEEKLSQAGIDDSIVADIAISVSELVNNAIIHGNRFNKNKQVEIRFTIKKSEVRISVEDQGDGFDFNDLPDPVADENLLREVGRGLFIVKSFVDEVDVKPVSSGGIKVQILKKLKV